MTRAHRLRVAEFSRMWIKAAPAAPLARRQRRAQPLKARAAHAEPQAQDSPDQQV
jgi:hypothetical protein